MPKYIIDGIEIYSDDSDKEVYNEKSSDDSDKKYINGERNFEKTILRNSS